MTGSLDLLVFSGETLFYLFIFSFLLFCFILCFFDFYFVGLVSVDNKYLKQ